MELDEAGEWVGPPNLEVGRRRWKHELHAKWTALRLVKLVVVWVAFRAH